MTVLNQFNELTGNLFGGIRASYRAWDTSRRYSSTLPNASRELGRIARHAEGRVVDDVAKVLAKYDGFSFAPYGLQYKFANLAEHHDWEGIRTLSEIMGSDDVIDAVKQNQSYVAGRIIDSLGDVAVITGDADTVKRVAQVAQAVDGVGVAEYVAWSLRDIAKNTRSTEDVQLAAETVSRYNGGVAQKVGWTLSKASEVDSSMLRTTATVIAGYDGEDAENVAYLLNATVEAFKDESTVQLVSDVVGKYDNAGRIAMQLWSLRESKEDFLQAVDMLKMPEVVQCDRRHPGNRDYHPVNDLISIGFDTKDLDLVRTIATEASQSDDYPFYSFRELAGSSQNADVVKSAVDTKRIGGRDFVYGLSRVKEKADLELLAEANRRYGASAAWVVANYLVSMYRDGQERHGSDLVEAVTGSDKSKIDDLLISLFPSLDRDFVRFVGTDDAVIYTVKVKDSDQSPWDTARRVQHLADIVRHLRANQPDEIAKMLAHTVIHYDAEFRNVSQDLYRLAINNPDLFRRVYSLMENLKEKDPVVAKLVAENIRDAKDIFGDKLGVVLDYFERRRDREYIRRVGTVGRGYPLKVGEVLEGVKLASMGNKTVEKLINLARYLSYCYELRLEPEVSEDLQASFNSAEGSLRSYMTELGIEDIESAFMFIPWIARGDETAIRTLRGERMEKTGMSKTYPIGSGRFDLGSVRKDLQTYAQMAGLDVIVEQGDLYQLKDTAQKMLAEVSKKEGLDKDVKAEVKPNLDRILTMVDVASRGYTLSVDPSDIKSQMLALQDVRSCLSPGGSNFGYTQGYLSNPNTFWAVVKDSSRDERNAVGRVTVFVGDGENGRKLARVSKVYSNVPVNESDIDGALRDYAKAVGAEFIREGQMRIDGLEDVYDDFVRRTEDGRISIGAA